MTREWLITGAGGQFGSVLLRMLVEEGAAALGLVSPAGPEPWVGRTVRADIAYRDQLAAVVRGTRPRIVIHAAAATKVGAAHADPGSARRINVEATQGTAELAAEIGARLVFVSTDLVFDGRGAPYDEGAVPSPLSVYGQTKAEAERVVLQSASALVVRLPLMYGLPAVSRPTTFAQQLEAVRSGEELRLFEDEFRTPLALVDAARSIVRAAGSEHTGMLHAAGPQRLSRLEMGRIAARGLGLSDRNIIPTRQGEMAFAEPRPTDVSLNCGLYSKIFGEAPGRAMAEVMVEIADEVAKARPGWHLD